VEDARAEEVSPDAGSGRVDEGRHAVRPIDERARGQRVFERATVRAGRSRGACEGGRRGDRRGAGRGDVEKRGAGGGGATIEMAVPVQVCRVGGSSAVRGRPPAGGRISLREIPCRV